MERLASGRGYTFEWSGAEGDDGAVLHPSARSLTLLSPQRDAFVNGSFWNQASNVFSFVPCWGDDGAPIEENVLEHLNAAMWHSSRAFGWSRGDVMCVDNEIAMHARTSFAGSRQIVVAFSNV